MQVLAKELQSDDGVANAAIAEAAERLERLAELLTKVKPHLEREARQLRETGTADGIWRPEDNEDACLDCLAMEAIARGIEEVVK
jgi:hypothetical protein